ncbi:hypothetical protein GCM10023091_09240 [Ravibacter arvi]|uniref:DUF2007 domain-containing protein n=1 Tax=Ravibacter arvi TaxID=2051041 RepID=A0ABP8LQW8_9BACT
MLENWVKILISDANPKAEISRMVLENNGIQAVIINKKDSSYLLGVFELYVPLEQEIIARQILENEISS